jgi:DNA-binding transcriptional MerR regulator
VTTTTLAIGDVAAHTGLSVHTLRYYERIGLLDRVERDGSGRRSFGADDLAWIDLLTKMRRTGMSISDLLRYTELVRAGAATYAERLAMLSAHREAVLARIAELTECLAVVDYKIDLYRGAAAS